MSLDVDAARGRSAMVEEVHGGAAGDELLGRQATTLSVLLSHGSGRGG